MDLYLEIRKMFIKAGISSPALEAREIVCYAAEKNREAFFRDGNLYIPSRIEDAAKALAKRRLDGEPVAYIIGEWEFYGLTLDIERGVLIPRADTELLADRVIELTEPLGEGARVLDLCAGSGCVGLAVAARAPSCRVVLAENHDTALRICRQNIRGNNLNSRVTCMPADALKPPTPSFFDFDVIACNPPYIPGWEIDRLDTSVRLYEPREALDGGEDGLVFYRSVSEKWRTALRQGGSLVFEVGYNQADEVKKVMASFGFEGLSVSEDTQGIPRIVEGVINL